MSSKRYPSRFESRAGFFASTRDECLSPRVRLECNPEIPLTPGEEHWLLDTSLDEVYWPCSHSRAIPSFPSQLEWKIGLSISIFSNESAQCIRWPKYWSFSFNISPSNEHPGLVSFRIDWLDLLSNNMQLTSQ